MTAASTARSAGRRTLAAAALPVAALVLVAAPTYGAPAAPGSNAPGAASPSTTVAGAPGDGGLAADQARASQLATEIRVQGLQLGQLAEQADAATIRVNQVGAALAGARSRAAATTAALAAARSLLTEQAIDAYTEGGHAQLAPQDVSHPELVGAYGEIVAGTQRDAITAYRQLRAQQAVQEAQLSAALQDASDAAAQLRADRAAAQSAASAEQSTLAGIQGRMATLVAAAQAAQSQATAGQVQATLSAQGQLPPATSAAAVAGNAVTTTTRPATVAAVPDRPVATAAPATARPVVVTRPAGPPSTPPATAPPTTAPAPSPPPHQASGAQVAIAYARAQLGKPYQWAGAGPATFDCSGLVMRAWGAAGVSFPHLAQAQYDMTARVPISQLLPGDLVFFGTPSNVYHVGIYVGGGSMIDAPATGQNVSIQNIYWSDLLSGGRVG